MFGGGSFRTVKTWRKGASMSPPVQRVVEVRDLCKSYAGQEVPHHVDLDVEEGEIVGLLGANGAGKTTAVECIEGLRRADAGSIRVFGLDPARDAARLRPLLGVQLQDSSLPDRMHVDEAIKLFSGPGAPAPD